MVFFLIILAILFLFSLFILLLLLSNIEIEIKDLYFSSIMKKNKKLKNYLLFIRLKLFGKLTILRVKIDNKKISKMLESKILESKIFQKFNDSNKIKEIILKNKKEILKKQNINYLKFLNIKIKKLILYMDISASNSILTSFAVAIIASLISIILAGNVQKYDKNKYKYKITPIYEYNPILKINLNCIIDVKIVHIINVIYMLIKKRSVKYDERTSNRGAYVCSND